MYPRSICFTKSGHWWDTFQLRIFIILEYCPMQCNIEDFFRKLTFLEKYGMEELRYCGLMTNRAVKKKLNVNSSKKDIRNMCFLV